MDIDIALWIMVAVAITGSIYLLDILVLKPKRQQSVVHYKQQCSSKKTEENKADEHNSQDHGSQDHGSQDHGSQDHGSQDHSSQDHSSQDHSSQDHSSQDHSSQDHIRVIAQLEKEPLVVEYSKSFFPVLFVVLIFRSFLVEPFTIPSGSMMPTLLAGDYILVNKFSYGLRLPVFGKKVYALDDPQSGDVMVFKYPENPKINYIKRVVGVAGDIIEYKNKRLWVNHKPVEREEVSRLPSRSEFIERMGEVEFHTWTHHMAMPPPKTEGRWQVPEGHYFVLGDNRDNSKDSRFWNFVPDNLVVGKAFAIWMHMPKSSWPTFSRNGIII